MVIMKVVLLNSIEAQICIALNYLYFALISMETITHVLYTVVDFFRPHGNFLLSVIRQLLIPCRSFRS